MKSKRIASIFALLIFYACGNEKADATHKQENKVDTIIPAKVLPEKSPKTKESVQKEIQEEELKPIIDNFNRINAIEKWTSTVKKDFGETTEGGEADYCYQDGKLEKIVYRQFGETFQKLTEFYLLDGKISFVFEETSKYNRPIYWDSIAMKENGDNQVWDAEKSEIIQTRNYFNDGKLIHQLVNEDKKAVLSPTVLTIEQKRLKNSFDNLLPVPEIESKTSINSNKKVAN